MQSDSLDGPLPAFAPSPLQTLRRRAGPDLPASPVTPGAAALCVLATLVIFADLLLWAGRPVLGLALFCLAVSLAAIAVEGSLWRGAWRPLAALVAALLAVIPLVNALTGLSLLFALSAPFAVAMALAGRGPLTTALGLLREYVISLRSLARSTPLRPSTGRELLTALANWTMPVALGLVFLGLFALANPVLERWITEADRWLFAMSVDDARVTLWLAVAGLTWPFLALWRMQRWPDTGRPTPRPLWFFNAASVRNALVLFNLLFAVQTVTDIAVLYGGAALPEGMTYAQYAHRGAYPLVVTALLAGIFALLAQRWMADHPRIRVLLLLWVAQNVALVLSSVIRLDLYVEAYGLTHLRFAAFVWMGLTGGGLSLMAVQLVVGQGALWMIRASGVMAVVTLYAISFVNVPALIARTNLALADAGGPVDLRYLCSLGPDAALVLQDRGCAVYVPSPADWREWGYRRATIRATLAAGTEGDEADGTYPDR